MNQNEWTFESAQSLLIKRKMDIACLLCGVAFGFYFDWTIVEMVFFSIFLWSLLGPVLSRYLALATLAVFSLVPVLLLFKRPERAEEFAIYAYYFLVMAVARAIIEVRTDKNEEEENRLT